MKLLHAILLPVFLGLSMQSHAAFEAQGTTLTKGKCDVTLTLQIAIQTNKPADITLIQSTLNECFSITCDLPCEDRKVGSCKVISKVVVVNYNTLNAADAPKFHYVQILPGAGISFVDAVGVPNSGKSSGGSWYRDEDPKVYCHEAMHLAGLPDHYRDCRADRIALGVDNCMDGKTCTAEQIAAGACPSCEGFEDDCMGNDVTKPFDCNRNIMEVVRLANDASFNCSDVCCKENPSHSAIQPPKLEIGVLASAGLGYYHLRDKEDKGDKLNLLGYDIGVGGYGKLNLDNKYSIGGTLRVDLSTVTKKQTETETNGPITRTDENHYGYRFINIALGLNFNYRTCENYEVFAGPEFGVIIDAKYRSYGSSTINGMTTNYGDKSFDKIPYDKKFQLGFNIGARRNLTINNLQIDPYANIHIPITNEIAFPNLNNRQFRFELGVSFPVLDY